MRPHRNARRSARCNAPRLAPIHGLLFALAAPAMAASADTGDVVVHVSGVATSGGDVGCALFGPGDAFPMAIDRSAQKVWMLADKGAVICRFANVPPGSWAVAVFQDANGNQVLDRNALGIPREAWGVSNDIRHTFRAPGFEESSFKVEAGREAAIAVKIAP